MFRAQRAVVVNKKNEAIKLFGMFFLSRGCFLFAGIAVSNTHTNGISGKKKVKLILCALMVMVSNIERYVSHFLLLGLGCARYERIHRLLSLLVSFGARFGGVLVCVLGGLPVPRH